MGNFRESEKLGIFTVFGLLENIVLHKEAWVAKLLGTHLSIKVHKKVKFSRRDNSSLAVKGLNYLHQVLCITFRMLMISHYKFTLR